VFLVDRGLIEGFVASTRCRTGRHPTETLHSNTQGSARISHRTTYTNALTHRHWSCSISRRNGAYRQKLREVVDVGYDGFVLDGDAK